jgi:hypothetical protein
VRLSTGLPARLIEPWNWLIRLKVRLDGVPPCVVAFLSAPAGQSRRWSPEASVARCPEEAFAQ